MSNRNISLSDQKNATRLKRLWNAKAKSLLLDQEKAALKLGVTQSAISQYLNCRIALNTDSVLAFAKLLKVEPTEIDPNLRQYNVQTSTIPVMGTLMNTETQQQTINAPRTDSSCYAILVDLNDYSPRVNHGEYIILDPTLPPALGDLVLAGKDLGVVDDLEDQIVHIQHPIKHNKLVYQGVAHVIIGIYLKKP